WILVLTQTLMRVCGYICTATAHQKIKIATFIGLHDMAQVQLKISSRLWLGIVLAQFRQTLLKYFIADLQMQQAFTGIELNIVTFVHGSQGTQFYRFRRDM